MACGWLGDDRDGSGAGNLTAVGVSTARWIPRRVGSVGERLSSGRQVAAGRQSDLSRT